jgi:hypothetical protein
MKGADWYEQCWILVAGMAVGALFGVLFGIGLGRFFWQDPLHIELGKRAVAEAEVEEVHKRWLACEAQMETSGRNYYRD